MPLHCPGLGAWEATSASKPGSPRSSSHFRVELEVSVGKGVARHAQDGGERLDGRRLLARPGVDLPARLESRSGPTMASLATGSISQARRPSATASSLRPRPRVDDAQGAQGDGRVGPRGHHLGDFDPCRREGVPGVGGVALDVGVQPFPEGARHQQATRHGRTLGRQVERARGRRRPGCARTTRVPGSSSSAARSGFSASSVARGWPGGAAGPPARCSGTYGQLQAGERVAGLDGQRALVKCAPWSA